MTKNSKGLIFILLFLLIGGGLIMASIWGEARRKELAYEVFSTIDKFKDYMKEQEAESDKIIELIKKTEEQEKTISELKIKVEESKKKQEIDTENFASIESISELTKRLEKLEKNNTAEKTKQILSLHTMANLRRALEDERGYFAEILTLKKSYPDWIEWEILDRYAEAGIPTFSTIKASFYDIIKSKNSIKNIAPNSNEITKWWSFIKNKTMNLIKIEKTKLLTNDQTTDDIIARAGNALEQNNLRHAFDEISRLEMSDSKAFLLFKSWHGKATDRMIVLKIANEMMMRITAQIGD